MTLEASDTQAIESLVKLGYQPLTMPYILPVEEEIFQRALAQIKKGQLPHAVVYQTPEEVEIWTIPNKPTIAEDSAQTDQQQAAQADRRVQQTATQFSAHVADLPYLREASH